MWGRRASCSTGACGRVRGPPVIAVRFVRGDGWPQRRPQCLALAQFFQVLLSECILKSQCWWPSLTLQQLLLCVCVISSATVTHVWVGISFILHRSPPPHTTSQPHPTPALMEEDDSSWSSLHLFLFCTSLFTLTHSKASISVERSVCWEYQWCHLNILVRSECWWIVMSRRLCKLSLLLSERETPSSQSQSYFRIHKNLMFSILKIIQNDDLSVL